MKRQVIAHTYGAALPLKMDFDRQILSREKEVSDITGPYRIDYQATKNLVDAATSAKVNNFILVTSLGTNKFGFPAAILNLFWGVLCWKRKAEEALIASGLNYAVAELLACMAKNPQLSCSKIVEVVAETTAPLTPTEKLLEKIPAKRPYVPPPKESVAAKEVIPVPTEPVTQSVPVPTEPVTQSIPVPSEPVTQEPVAPKEDEAPAIVKDVKPRPLSPYAAYADLKPPTSPIPTFSTSLRATKSKEVDAVQVPVETNVDPLPDTISNASVGEEEVKQAEEKKERPLSPYAFYADLKPPTSPTPASTGPKKTASEEDNSELPGGSDVLKTVDGSVDTIPSTSVPEAAPVSAELPGDNSDVLETVDDSVDATPSTSVPEAAPDNNVTDTPLTSEDNKTADQPKPRPLSPYTMYEDMKPPTSPLPSPVINH